MSDLKKCTVAQLKEQCQQQGVATSGNKAELILRLQTALSTSSTSSEENKDTQNAGKKRAASSSKIVKKQKTKIEEKTSPDTHPESNAMDTDDDKPEFIDEPIIDQSTQAIKISANDPLALAKLFEGAEEWEASLRHCIESQPLAAKFIGPGRGRGVVPVREMTFQALKPNKPENWKVVVFGQGPYKRMESATGISFFDNAFDKWTDSEFGRTTSMRCIIKSAFVWKHGIDKDNTNVDQLRALLKKNNIAQPPQWFQSLLTQGVLLVSACLTESCDGAITTKEHTKFWTPVMYEVIRTILAAKERVEDKELKGVIFAWWGKHAKELKSFVEKIASNYPTVQIKHVDHFNPAARGERFCYGNHFKDLNDCLESMGMSGIDWLPVSTWHESLADTSRRADVTKMGEFISETQKLHKFYMDRLAGVKEEKLQVLEDIMGIQDVPLVSFADAVAALSNKPSASYLERAKRFGLDYNQSNLPHALSPDQMSAVYLYTCACNFYQQLNEALRDPFRKKIRPYFKYLRLLLSALCAIHQFHSNPPHLWRGVSLDISHEYQVDSTIVWWGVSSCSSEKSVASSFLGSKGMLFEIVAPTAVPIRQWSAFSEEEEYILPPGTELKVKSMKRSGKNHHVLLEDTGVRRVC